MLIEVIYYNEKYLDCVPCVKMQIQVQTQSWLPADSKQAERKEQNKNAATEAKSVRGLCEKLQPQQQARIRRAPGTSPCLGEAARALVGDPVPHPRAPLARSNLRVRVRAFRTNVTEASLSSVLNRHVDSDIKSALTSRAIVYII